MPTLAMAAGELLMTSLTSTHQSIRPYLKLFEEQLNDGELLWSVFANIMVLGSILCS